mgnify:CR=1 FL=1|jgi:hypothetical protein|tara:strand:- start:2852 stop:3217 length:366 start_codon:yes stop_codon:yes gene_type:complete
MAYTGTVATEAELDLAVGENVDTTGWTEANKNLLIAQAEGFLCTLLEYDIVTNWASLQSKFKPVLSEWASRSCALMGIAYNMINYSSRIEAEDMVNIHTYRLDLIEKMIREGRFQKALGVS